MDTDRQREIESAPGRAGQTRAGNPERAPSSFLPWGLLALSLLGLGGFYYAIHGPAAEQHARLSAKLKENTAALASATQAASAAKTQLAQLQSDRDELARQVQRAEQRRKEAERALKQLQTDLGAALEAEIASGDVLVRTRDGKVVVDLADRLLFDSGQVEISESGQKLLLQVAPTLLRLKNLVFQVAGHTDAARVISPELRERYPTNWELSTARATNVVRFLQERGHVPGARLLAAGFAKYRPVADNRILAERAKNRRIEITLVQRP